MKRSNRLIRQLAARALVGTMGALLVVGSASGAADSQQVATERLAQARAAFAGAKNSPTVQSYALKQLLEAEKTLQLAEAARNKAADPNPMIYAQGYSRAEQEALYDDVARLAYLADRASQGAIAYAEGMVAATDQLKLGQEKAEIRLQKSVLEKKRLQRDMDAMIGALERSRQQLSLATGEAERAGIMADIRAKEALLAKAQGAAREREAAEARALAAASALDAQKAKDELQQLLKELSELQGQLTDRGIVLTVGDVLFATGKASLNASAQGSMDKIAQFLKKNPKRNLLVEGHTDSVGSDDFNLGLSEQRAASVKNALLQHDIAAGRIVTIGYGKKFPVSSNGPESGRQQNRRVEVVILNEGVKPESQFRH